ncbi:MAG: putative ABC transporter permease [Eubacteriales bacterium]|nr:putative ABC transporter permease [Eubacteriales bacterium]
MEYRNKRIERAVYTGFFFFAGCFFGWIWEMVVFLFSHGDVSIRDMIFNLRGVLHGPWVPIYGVGFVLLMGIKKVVRGRVLPTFCGCVLGCGLLEYLTSYILEKLFHGRWWDYSDKFLNLNGRIYAGGLLFFGIAGTAVIFLAEPAFHRLISKIPEKGRRGVLLILLLLFITDVLFSVCTPNTGIGVSIVR